MRWLIAWVNRIVFGAMAALLAYLSGLYWYISVPILVAVIVYLGLCFAYVAEGTSKSVVRAGGYIKTLFAKKGYRLNSDGYVVPLNQGEKPEYAAFWGGIRWVSLLKPLGIDKIYTRTMKFVKSLPDGYEKRADKNTDFLLTGTQYQYTLLFEKAEDSEGLPLSGQMTMTARIVNPYKALFLVKDWFDALVGRVLPRVRQYISEHTYDKIINDPGTQLDKDVFKLLQKSDDADLKKRNILQILWEEYGVDLVALETVNVDPPPEYRETTLQKFRAEQEAGADLRRQEIEASAFAAQTSGTEIAMLSKWTGKPVEDLQKELQAAITADPDHGFETWLKKYPVVAKNWNLIQQKQLGVKPNLFGNADGSSLDPVMSTIASLISLAKGSGSSSSSTPSGNPSGGAFDKKGDKKKREEEKDKADLEELDRLEAEENKS